MLLIDIMRVKIVLKIEFILFLCAHGWEPYLDKYDRMQEVKKLVQIWSSQIGAKLTDLSREMTKEDTVKESFRCLDSKLVKEDAALLVHEMALNIRSMMDSKAQAVESIAEYAEFLSYHRNQQPIFENSTYYFYNADNLTKTEENLTREAELSEEILKCNKLKGKFRNIKVKAY